MLLVAVGFGLTPVPLSIKSSLQTPTNHCSYTLCGIPAVVLAQHFLLFMLLGQSKKDS